MPKRSVLAIVLAALAVALALVMVRPGVSSAATPVRIMPLGDSITGSPGCWRALLWNRLQSTGYQAAVDNSTSRPQTVIGYKPGAAAAAREIGKLLEVPSAQIQPMPQDLAGQAGNNAVIVVIGADKASD